MTATASAAASTAQQRLVRIAARSVVRAALAHAYGHCSLRLDEHSFLVCAAKPMGLITSDDPGVVVPVHGELPDGVLGEVRIHQQIYKNRPDVAGVVRSMPRDIMTLSAAGITPAPRHGMGSYFSPFVPLWNDVQLVRSDEQAESLARTMADSAAIVMRGNGAVVAAEDLATAVALTWYLEDAARIELQLRSAGLASGDAILTREQAVRRATRSGRIFERMWEYLGADDPEWLETHQTNN